LIVLMSLVALVAIVGLVMWWRTSKSAAKLPRRLFILLVVHSMLAVPFMVIRLFGARDALEAVQGRYLLFLSGPAIVILIVWGLSGIGCQVSSVKRYTSSLYFGFYSLLGVLLVGSVGQLIFMAQTYPPLLPVQTTLYTDVSADALPQVSLNDQARLIDVVVSDKNGTALDITLIWQVEDAPFLEDYQVELALVDASGQPQSGWRAYQTQARYPTRAWEAGDVVQDEGWLPLTGLPAGVYQIQMRILGQHGTITEWQTVGLYMVSQEVSQPDEPVVWHNGKIAHRPVLYHERETVQLTGNADIHLVGPDGIPQQYRRGLGEFYCCPGLACRTLFFTE